MRTVGLCVIDHARSRVRNKAESTRSFCLWIFHHYDVNDFTPFLEVRFQRFVVGPIIEAADEKFSRTFWLTDRILEQIEVFGKKCSFLDGWKRNERVIEFSPWLIIQYGDSLTHVSNFFLYFSIVKSAFQAIPDSITTSPKHLLTSSS